MTSIFSRGQMPDGSGFFASNAPLCGAEQGSNARGLPGGDDRAWNWLIHKQFQMNGYEANGQNFLEYFPVVHILVEVYKL